ncbi:MAG: TlpA disulfide reductase family protein [Blastocatellia bacterium]
MIERREQRRSRTYWQGLAAGLLGLAVGIALGAGRQVEATGWQEEPLRTLDGKPVPLAELRGKVVVFSFGGTWVPHLTRELAALQRVASRYDSREVAVFWVSINSDQPGARHAASNEDLREWMRRESVRLTVLRDPKMASYRAFELAAIPTIVILDREGKVAHRLVGIGSEPGELFNDLVREIERLRK